MSKEVIMTALITALLTTAAVVGAKKAGLL